MKVVVQRVREASCTIDGQLHGTIGQGFLLLVGICDADTPEVCQKMAGKIARLRIFEDDNHKMNLDIHQIQGSILSISQFTLYADCHKGNRPSFVKAGDPGHAKELYLYFNEYLRSLQIPVEEGVFGADMAIRLWNDGPVTIVLDSDTW